LDASIGYPVPVTVSFELTASNITSRGCWLCYIGSLLGSPADLSISNRRLIMRRRKQGIVIMGIYKVPPLLLFWGRPAFKSPMGVSYKQMIESVVLVETRLGSESKLLCCTN
jgi:hypothetical protein